MSGLTAVPGDKFTDEMLAKNFASVVKGFHEMDNRMDMLDNGLRHLGGHIGELFEMAKAAAETQAKVKTPGRIKPFLIGAVVGVVGYRYYKKNIHKINVVIENANEGAKQRFTDSVEKLKEQGATSD